MEEVREKLVEVLQAWKKSTYQYSEVDLEEEELEGLDWMEKMLEAL
jgi:ActR/RegA family two-component response regulator